MDICPVVATGAIRAVDYVVSAPHATVLIAISCSDHKVKPLPLFWSYWSDQAILTYIEKPKILDNVEH